MSSVEIITTIIILLAVLLCYAFTQQTIKSKKQQKERFIKVLMRRNNTFKFMLNGFPKGFLPKDLAILVQSSLVETLDQLVKLEPKVSSYAQDLQLISQQIAEAQRESGPQKMVKMANPQQVKEVKMCLEELNKFIHIQESKGAIPKNRADSFRSQIKQLVLHITVDTYEMQGNASLQNDKIKLGHHYYDLALKLLIREGRGEHKDERVNAFKEILKELAPKLELEEANLTVSEEDSALQEEMEEQWDKFTDTDNHWKKNSVYD